MLRRAAILASRSLVALAALAALAGCTSGIRVGSSDESRAEARTSMVANQIEARGIHDPAILEAMRVVPRHEFLPEGQRYAAYEDRWLPIAEGQHMSQPYTVALMTALSRAGAGSRVLEIGTGSGYQAAVLAQMGAEVYSIEILPSLAREAAATLRRLGYDSVKLRTGDGFRGWPEAAPFEAILVTAAAPYVPADLLDQLAVGGHLVIPIGTDDEDQELELHVRTLEGVVVDRIAPAYFVPMTGEIRQRP